MKMHLPPLKVNPIGLVVVLVVTAFFMCLYSVGYNSKNVNERTMVSLKYLLAVGIDIAEAGGKEVREVRFSADLKEQSKGKTKEGANDPLTAGDLLSHKAMFYGLKNVFPNIKIISEEHDSEMRTHTTKLPVPHWDLVHNIIDDIEIPLNEITVWIDPLDATQEYTENLLDFVTTMVCVAVRGKPVIGIIHQPFKNFTAWAWVSHGVSTNSHFATRSGFYNPSKHRTIIVSRSHAGKVEQVAKAAFGPETIIIPAGGAGYKALQVAQGKADAYIHVTLIKKWDVCAGNAILNALGGEMTTLDGQPIDYGDSEVPKNEKGLIASLQDHEKYLEKLSGLKI